MVATRDNRFAPANRRFVPAEQRCFALVVCLVRASCLVSELASCEIGVCQTSASGILRYVSSYCDFHPDVVAYLQRRHDNEAKETDVLPICSVSTGLLIALHSTGKGRNDTRPVDGDAGSAVNEEQVASLAGHCASGLEGRNLGYFPFFLPQGTSRGLKRPHNAH